MDSNAPEPKPDSQTPADHEPTVQIDSTIDDRATIVPRVQLARISSGVDGGVSPMVGTQPQKRVGKYDVFSEIARGGVGVVRRGRDQEIGRDVALKFLLDDHKNDEVILHRFIEEAQIAGQLQHPGIIPVYDLGLIDEKPFFSMKLIKGETFADVLQRRSDPKDDIRHCLGVFEQVCHTMAYAHARGVIHRDLKPGNIMVGAFGEVLVVDWGMGKVLGADKSVPKKPESEGKQTLIATARSTGESSHSIAGSIMGTPAYMAPEQARGEIDDIDARADVFALGAILCEMLTRQPPFLAADVKSLLYQSAQGMLDGAIKRIESSGADEGLIALTKACLAPAREDRPKDASAVAERMNAHLATAEKLAQEARIKVVAAKRTHKMLVAIGLIVAAGLAAALILWRQAEEQRGRAEVAKLEVEKRNEKLEVIAYAGRLRLVQDSLEACHPGDFAEILKQEDDSRRGFAWRWLFARAAKQEPRGALSSTEPVSLIEWSPDGTQILYGKRDQAILRFSIAPSNGGSPPRELTHGVDAAYSPTGTHIAAVTQDKLTLWDASTQRGLMEKTVSGDWSSICFSADGERVVTGSRSGRIRVAWAADLEEIDTFEGYEPVRDVSFSPDGSRLLVAAGGTAHIIDAESGEIRRQFRYYRDHEKEKILEACFSPDGKLVLLAGDMGRVNLWDATDGTLLRELEPHQQTGGTDWNAWTVDFSPDGRFVLSGGSDCLVRIHSVTTGKRVGAYRLGGTHDIVLSARFDPSGSSIIAAGAKRTMTWSLDSLPAPLELIGHTEQIDEASATSAGRFAFSAGRDGLRKWDLLTGAQQFFCPVTKNSRSLDISPDERAVAVAGVDCRVRILDAATGEVLRSFVAPPGTIPTPTTPGRSALGIFRVRYHTDGRMLAAAAGSVLSSRDTALKAPILIFDSVSGEMVATLRGHGHSVTAIEFSPDGKYLASLDAEGNLFLWDAESWARIHVLLEGDDEYVGAALAFDPSGETLYSGHAKGHMFAFDVKTGAKKWSFQPYNGFIWDIDFDSEGRRFLIAGTGGSTSIWDVRFRERLLTIPDNVWHNSAHFAADDDRILIGSWSGDLRLFEIEPPPASFAKRATVRQAALLVKELSLTNPLIEDVRRILAADTNLDESVRAAALAIAAGIRN